jgi:uncharacterized membrane protein YfcA
VDGWLLSYSLLGVFGGFIAGLFGVGGGLTIVPILFMLFSAQGFPEAHIMHLALGTAMTSIVFTSITSMRAHHRHGAVRWDIVRAMVPGLLLGTFGGSLFVGLIPTRPLVAVFVLLVYYAAAQLILDFKPQAQRQLPAKVGLFTAGSVIGSVSSLVAAGGGFLSVPFMLFCNVSIHSAVGTSSALGFPIAVAGMVGYIVAGWGTPNLPPHTFGYLYWPALLGVVALSMLAAPYGAQLAHRLPVKKLKRAFGGFLALLATKMAYSLWAG